MHTLLAADEQSIANQIKRGLAAKAHLVDVAENSLLAYDRVQDTTYDFVILDFYSPKIDGLTFCRRLRREGRQTPILLLTAQDAIQQRVDGLAAGADDCLSKPFPVAELLARLRAVNRRNSGQWRSVTRQIADLCLNLRTHCVQRGGQPIDLSPKEFALLDLLMRHPSQVFTRTMLLQQIWQQENCDQLRCVNTLVDCLRRKIDDPFAVKLIQTVQGLGYVMRDPTDPDAILSLPIGSDQQISKAPMNEPGA